MPEVENASVSPYNTIVLLQIELNTGKYGWGSGALIDDRHVLTCAHNLLSRKGEYRATNITAYFEYSSGAQPDPAQGVRAMRGFYCDPYANGDRTWDIGVVRLAAVVGRPLYMTPFAVDAEPLKLKFIAGYPGNRHFYMWQDEDVWTGINVPQHSFAYVHETEAGSSGSPVFEYSAVAQTLRQYGVHSGLAENLEDKVGVLITSVTAAFVNRAVRMTEPLFEFLIGLPAPVGAD